MLTYAACTVADRIRFDLYGEVQEAGRIAVLLTADEALRISRDLGTRAVALGALREPAAPNPEDLV